MSRHQRKSKCCKIYNFIEYKIQKPFFKNQMKIAIGAPLNESYYMVKNVCFNEKQILALKHEQDPSTIILVEAKIKNGQLTNISMLPPGLLEEVSILIDGSI